MYKSEELTNATAEIVVKRAKRSLERTKVSFEMTKTRSKKTIEHDLPQQHETLKSTKEQTAHALDQLQKSAPHAKHDRETGLVRSRHAVTAAEDTLAKLQKDRDGLTLKSPMDGTAYYGTLADGKWAGTGEAIKALRKGEKVQAMQVAMTVVGKDLDVHVGVQEADLHQFVAGLDAAVVPTGFPSLSWKGKTTDAAPIAGMDGMFAATIKLGVSAPRVVAGMRAKVTVDVAELKGVLLLPVTAVKDEAGKKWVSKKGAEKPAEVKVGKTDGKMVEIVDGLREGDEVLSIPK
jgi:multidrug efflux pump subunit AcrA (membrane-fusion protein)